jgi:hypothetical protein
MTPTEEQLVKDELAMGRDPRAVARDLGIPLSAVRPTLISSRRFEPISEDGYGRPKLRQYIVSRKNCHDTTWPKDDLLKINVARHRYDAGEIEMCQGRDGDWFILYAIPRARPEQTREPWLTVTAGED